MSLSPETITSVGVSLATAVCGVWAARAARRSPRAERRDDFTAVTDRMEKSLARQETRIDELEADAETQRLRIGEQDEAIGWLLNRVRGLVGYIRQSGLEPPAAEPMPDRARRYIHHIDT